MVKIIDKGIREKIIMEEQPEIHNRSPEHEDDSSASPAAPPGLEERDREEISPLSPEELPTLQWPDIQAELAEFEDYQGSLKPAPGDVEDAMTWLEGLAAGQGMPVEEMPTLVSSQPSSKTPSPPKSRVDRQSDPASMASALDYDPIAWLEQLAVEQSSPLEELPSVADRLLASDIPLQAEIAPDSTINDPAEIDQALIYLEKLATGQGIDLSVVVVESERAIGTAEEALALLDALAIAGVMNNAVAGTKASASPSTPALPTNQAQSAQRRAQAEPGNDLSKEMPDDPMAALAWLSRFAEESEEAVEVVLEADTVDTPLVPDEQAASSPDDSDPLAEEKVFEKEVEIDVLDEMPDDPDEAIAWMKRLAENEAQSDHDTIQALTTESEAATPLAAAETDLPNSAALAAVEDAVEDGDSERVIELYQSILEAEAADEQMIASLEKTIENEGESPQLLRLLGDAYMQLGQVDKAVAVFRKGFEHL